MNLTQDIDTRLVKRRRLSTAESISQSPVDSGGEEDSIKQMKKVPVKFEPECEENGIDDNLSQICEDSEQLEPNLLYSGKI